MSVSKHEMAWYSRETRFLAPRPFPDEDQAAPSAWDDWPNPQKRAMAGCMSVCIVSLPPCLHCFHNADRHGIMHPRLSDSSRGGSGETREV